MSTDGTSIASTSSLARTPAQTEMKGWLLKWTNYIQGYQKRYFVLSNTKLSYYRYVNIRSVILNLIRFNLLFKKSNGM